ncbi:hypothetical protein FQZ97_1200190 [compost metagenome]
MSNDFRNSTPSSSDFAPLIAARMRGKPCFCMWLIVSGLAESAVIGHFSASGTDMNNSGRFTISQPTMYAS